jgi:hypothetical protein
LEKKVEKRLNERPAWFIMQLLLYYASGGVFCELRSIQKQVKGGQNEAFFFNCIGDRGNSIAVVAIWLG